MRGLQEGSSACEPQLCHALSGAFSCRYHCLRCPRGHLWWGVGFLGGSGPSVLLLEPMSRLLSHPHVPGLGPADLEPP